MTLVLGVSNDPCLPIEGPVRLVGTRDATLSLCATSGYPRLFYTLGYLCLSSFSDQLNILCPDDLVCQSSLPLDTLCVSRAELPLDLPFLSLLLRKPTHTFSVEKCRLLRERCARPSGPARGA